MQFRGVGGRENSVLTQFKNRKFYKKKLNKSVCLHVCVCGPSPRASYAAAAVVFSFKRLRSLWMTAGRLGVVGVVACWIAVVGVVACWTAVVSVAVPWVPLVLAWTRPTMIVSTCCLIRTIVRSS